MCDNIVQTIMGWRSSVFYALFCLSAFCSATDLLLPSFPEINAKQQCSWSNIGVDYRGTQNVTLSGYLCLHWINVGISNSEAGLSGWDRSTLKKNYCRNPDSGPGGPWCFVASYPVKGPRWEVCGIPSCFDRQHHLNGNVRIKRSARALPRIPNVKETGCNNACVQPHTCVHRELSCGQRPGNIVEGCVEKLVVSREPLDPGASCLAGFGPEIRYWFDLASGTCRTFAFMGCDGNGNNFHSEEECLGKMRNWMCFQWVDGGSTACASGETVNSGTKYAYHWVVQSCLPFHYAGCGGNHNRFESEADCKTVCMPWLN